MKKKSFLAISAVLAVATTSVLGFTLINQKRLADLEEKKVVLPDSFTYTAHTGCMNTKQNSLESINEAVKYGVKTVEFDLHFNQNLEPVLSHDEPAGGEVTLDEAFKKISEYPHITVNVDVKSTAALEKVLPCAQKYALEDRIFFTGIHDGFVKAAAENGGGVPYFLNVNVKHRFLQNKKYILSLVEKVKASGAIGINFNQKGASKQLVDIFHQNGLLVSVWTVDKKSDMVKNLSYAPDNITTRRPDIMQELLK